MTVVQETVKENGHLSEERERQAVAIKTKPAPKTEIPVVVPQSVPVHENGVVERELFDAEIRLIIAGVTVPHIDKAILQKWILFRKDAFLGTDRR